MNLNINKYLLSAIVTGLIFIFNPTTTYAEGITNINKLFVVTQQKTIINYEKNLHLLITQLLIQISMSEIKRY